jgi:acylphosphatase
VRNREDGRVEAVFEGGPDDVAAMVNWSQQGPPHAQVTGVEVTDEPPEGATGFLVR